MAIQKSDEIEALLAELDGKTSDKNPEDRFQGVKTLCVVSTRTVMQKVFGNSEENSFEISSPCILPKENGGSLNFLGMETVRFCNFTPSQKGEIYCVFEVVESNERFAVKYENLAQVFGMQGEAFHNAIEVFANLSIKREEIMNSIDNREVMDSKHMEDPNYGVW